MISTSNTDKDEKFLQTAEALASIWSKDPSSKVACIAVGLHPNQVAWGYNGFPPGLKDLPERLENRDLKLKLTRHAEPNALSNATFPVHTLYVTRHPCDRCAIDIIAYRTVRRVVYRIHPDFEARWEGSIMEAATFFGEAGIQIEGRP